MLCSYLQLPPLLIIFNSFIYGLFLFIFSIVITLILTALGQLSRPFPILRFLGMGEHRVSFVILSITIANLILYNSKAGQAFHTRQRTFAMQSIFIAAYLRALFTCMLMLTDYLCFERYTRELEFCTFLAYI